MRCNFGLLGNINVIVKFCSASDVMHERRFAPHDDNHLSSIDTSNIYTVFYRNKPPSKISPSPL